MEPADGRILETGDRLFLCIAAFVLIALIVITMLLRFHLGWSWPWAFTPWSPLIAMPLIIDAIAGPVKWLEPRL